MKTALVLACDDNFIPYTAVVAHRIARNAAEKFPIIVISDGVTDDNKARARRFCPHIHFMEAAPLFEGRPLPARGTFSRAAHLRLFLDQLLADFDRAIYLDSDISLLTDVSPLLALQPKAASIIAAHDIPLMLDGTYRERLGISSPYFNSGVMVLDLNAIRSERIFADALRYALDHPERCEYVDQDPLNAVLDGRWQVLDWRWNALSQMREYMPKDPFIRHFTRYKPWARKKVGIEERFVDEWRADLTQSPWPDHFHEQSLRYPAKQAFASLGAAVLAPVTGRSRDRRNYILADILTSIELAADAGKCAETLPLPPSARRPGLVS